MANIPPPPAGQAEVIECGRCAREIIRCTVAGPKCKSGWVHVGGNHLCAPVRTFKGEVATPVQPPVQDRSDLGRKGAAARWHKAEAEARGNGAADLGPCPDDCNDPGHTHFRCVVCRSLMLTGDGQAVGVAGSMRCTDQRGCEMRLTAAAERLVELVGAADDPLAELVIGCNECSWEGPADQAAGHSCDEYRRAIDCTGGSLSQRA